VKKKKPSNLTLYGIIALFILLVSIVELVKSINASKTYSQVFEQTQNSPALIALPIFSIAIVLLLALPKKDI